MMSSTSRLSDDSINVPSEGHKDFKVWRMCFSFSILISSSWYPYDFMGHAEVMSEESTLETTVSTIRYFVLDNTVLRLMIHEQML